MNNKPTQQSNGNGKEVATTVSSTPYKEKNISANNQTTNKNKKDNNYNTGTSTATFGDYFPTNYHIKKNNKEQDHRSTNNYASTDNGGGGGGGGDATTIFNDFVESRLIKNGYLNTDDILNALKDKINNLERLLIFKEIRNINKYIDTTIICYMQSKSIRIYSELENYIIKQLANYRKMKEIPLKFEEFGLGNLMKNNLIMKIFGFYTIYTTTTGHNNSSNNNNHNNSVLVLPNISTNDILRFLHEFIITQPVRYLKTFDFPTLEKRFIDYLKSIYMTATTTTVTSNGNNTSNSNNSSNNSNSNNTSNNNTSKSNSLLGLDLDFKSIYLSTTRIRSLWLQELRNAKEKFSVEYKESLQEIFQNFFQNNDKKIKNSITTTTTSSSNDSNITTMQDHLLSIYNINILTLYEQLINFGINPFQSYYSVMKHSIENQTHGLHLSIASIIRKSNEYIHKITFNTMLCNRKDIKTIELYRIPIKNTRKCIISSIIGLLIHLSTLRNTETNTIDTNDSTNTTNNSFNIWCLQHLCNDIPIICINATKSLLLRLLQPDMFIVEEAKNNKKSIYPDTVSIDWNIPSRNLELLLGNDSTHTTTKCTMSLSDYLGILTGIILFQRVISAHIVPSATDPDRVTDVIEDSESSQNAAEITTDITTRLQALLESPTRSSMLVDTVQTLGPLVGIFQALSIVEREVILKRHLPVFECTRTGGSFLYFLQDQLLQQLDQSAIKSTSDNETDTARNQETAVSGLGQVLKLLQHMLFPYAAAVQGEQDGASSSAAYIQEEESNRGVVDVYERIAIVQTHLLSVLTSRELALSRGTSSSTVEYVSLFDFVISILLEIESQVVTEDENNMHGCNTLPSFLNMIENVLSEDSTILDRLNALFQSTDVGASQSDEILTSGNSICTIQGPTVSLSVAITAVQALFNPHSNTNDIIPTSFTTLHDLEEYTAAYLQYVLCISSFKTAMKLSQQALRELQNSNKLSIIGTKGSIVVSLGVVPTATAILAFPVPVAADPLTEEMTSEVFSEDMRQNLLQLILAVPIGCSLLEFTLWEECRYSALLSSTVEDASAAYPSLVEFILAHSTDLQKMREDVVYYNLPGSADCFAIPCSSMSQLSKPISSTLGETFGNAYKNKDYLTVSAWCLSSSLGLVPTDQQSISAVLNSLVLQAFESYGSDAVPRLCSELLTISFALPVDYSGSTSGSTAMYGSYDHYTDILYMCLNALVFAAQLTLDKAQQVVVEWVQHQPSGEPQRKFLRSLIAVSSSSKGQKLLPKLAQFLTNISAHSARYLLASQNILQEGSSAQEQELTTDQKHRTNVVITSTVSSKQEHNMNSIEPMTPESEQLVHTDSNNKENFILQLLEREFRYTEGGRCRPSQESADGRKLHNALQLLSASLYSSDVHFIMELIQNADDNQYDTNIIPTLRLQLFPHAIVVYNNEIGFREDNIIAICNVNGSTKANKTGYIGQKGIGFKSVFAVSDCPEVHSNGFHIKFHKDTSMLEPIWIDPTADCAWPDHYDAGTDIYYQTCLRLPLDADTLKNADKLNQDIEEAYNGKLILFLKQLDRMILEDRQRNYTIEYYRRQLCEQSKNWWRITETKRINTNNTTTNTIKIDSYYLILTHTFQPLIHRINIIPSETSISVAFKFIKTKKTFKAKKLLDSDEEKRIHDNILEKKELEEENMYLNTTTSSNTSTTSNDNISSNSNTNMPVLEEIRLDFTEKLLPIYAYLPTLTKCFQFIIQADFILPTSRETIQDNIWNIQLFQKIPSMFIDIVAEMALWAVKRDDYCDTDFPILSQLSNSTYLSIRIELMDVLSAIPRRSSTSKDMINAVITDIYHQLQDIKFIPTSSSSDSMLCCPREVYATHHLDFNPAEYIPEALLYAATGKRYALQEAGEYEMDPELSGPDALNIPVFDVSAVLSVLQYLSSATANIGLETGTDKRAEHIQSIAGALLLLDILVRHQQRSSSIKSVHNTATTSGRTLPKLNNTTNSFGKKGLIPIQTIKRSSTAAMVSNTTLTGSSLTGYLSENLREKLRNFYIWPISTNAVNRYNSIISLSEQIIFLPTKKADNFTTEQQKSFQYFQDRIYSLDTKLLEEAGNILPGGKEMLRLFLEENFKPIKRVMRSQNKLPHSRDITSSTSNSSIANIGVYSGGLEMLTADVVLYHVIIPAYRKFAEYKAAQTARSAGYSTCTSANIPAEAPIKMEDDSDVHADTTTMTATPPATDESMELSGLTRTTAAAFLAFFFASKWSMKLNMANNTDLAHFIRDTGVVVPILTARDGNKGLVWDSPDLVLVQKFDFGQILHYKEAGKGYSSNANILPEYEVHVGIEIVESGSSVLAGSRTTTALRQLQWKIIDPIVAAIAFARDSSSVSSGLPMHIATSTKISYTTEEIHRAFAAKSVQDAMQARYWKDFLVRLGLVNMFGMYTISTATPIGTGNNTSASSSCSSSSSIGMVNATVQAPQLLRFIDHLLRNATTMCISKHTIVRDLDEEDVQDNSNADMEVELQQSTRDREYMPLFVPQSSSKGIVRKASAEVREVSREVYETMLAVLPLIVAELSASSKRNSSAILMQLSTRTWCPLVVNDHVVQALCGECEKQQRYFMTGPENIFIVDEQLKIMGRTGIPPHCMTLPKELHSLAATSSGILNFPVWSNTDPEFTMQYLSWLSRQGPNSTIVSSIAAMVAFYQAIEQCVLSTSDSQQRHRYIQIISTLLAQDAPIIWIPHTAPTAPVVLTQYNSSAGYPGLDDAYCSGTMLPLSQFVRSDPSEKLMTSKSPVKVLEQYYPGQHGAAVVIEMFSCKTYCSKCQAKEGMFGVHGGQTLSTSVCTCNQSQFCKEIISKYSRPVRKSPSAVDMIALLEVNCLELNKLHEEHAEIIVQQSSQQNHRVRSLELQTQCKDLQTRIHTVQCEVSDILTAFSMNIWKCYQIKLSLHPYSFTQLQALSKAFQSKTLLPTLQYKSFVSAAVDTDTSVSDWSKEEENGVDVAVAPKLIAVDDVGVYELFSDVLESIHQQGEVQWLEVCRPADSTGMILGNEETNLLFTSGDQHKYSYNLEEFRLDEQTLLQSEDTDFLNAVRSISPLTFFAPTNKLALYEFLEISKLSDFIVEEWEICEVTDNISNRTLVQTFISIMNNLLTFTYAYYYHGGHKDLHRNTNIEGGCSEYLPTMLSEKLRMKNLLAMNIVQCSTLQRKIELRGLTSSPQHRHTVESFRRCLTDRENILYLSTDITVSDLQSLAVNMITKVIKIEMALLECKQQTVELQQLQEDLESVAKYTEFTRLLNRLEDRKLCLPEGKLGWRLKASDIGAEKEDMEVVEDSSTDCDMEPSAETIEAALKGFGNLRQACRQRTTAVVTKNSLTEKDIKYAQFSAEKNRSMKEQGRESVAKAAVLRAQTTTEDDTLRKTLPYAPEEATEAVLVNLTVEEAAPIARAGIPNYGFSSGAYDQAVSRKCMHMVDEGVGGSAGSEGGEYIVEVRGRNAGGGRSESEGGVLGTYNSGKIDGGIGSSSGMEGCGKGGTGRYLPNLSPTPASLLSRDVLEISAEQLSSFNIELCDMDIIPSTHNDSTTLHTADATSEVQKLVSSSNSGRLGEHCAVRILQNIFRLNPQLLGIPVVALDWVNETVEAGYPYDIRITLSDGTYKYCEVKTRSVAIETVDPVVFHRQWIISPKEVSSASEYGHLYFGLFLNICTDKSLTSLSTIVKDVQIIGLRRGLIEAIVVEHSASLFVQIN